MNWPGYRATSWPVRGRSSAAHRGGIRLADRSRLTGSHSSAWSSIGPAASACPSRKRIACVDEDGISSRWWVTSTEVSSGFSSLRRSSAAINASRAARSRPTAGSSSKSKLRVRDQGAGDADPSPFSLGACRDLAVGKVGTSQQRQQLPRPRAVVARIGPPERPQRRSDTGENDLFGGQPVERRAS